MQKNRKKRHVILAMLLGLSFALVPTPVNATNKKDQKKEKEEVVVEETIEISTPEDLQELAANCIDNDWSRNKIIVLKNDINVSAIEFYGIPTFGGKFEGQGYTISGLRFVQEGSVVGLFRYTQSTAEIEGLHVEGSVQPKGTSTVVGGIVGSNAGTIRNCTFSGLVSGKEQIGGIVGENKAGSILENCSVSGTVYGNHYIGGIAGNNKGVIRQCTNEAKVNTEVEQNTIGISMDMVTSVPDEESNNSSTNIGGIVGTNTGVIRNCNNKENVGYKKMGYNVGGIAGSQNGYIVDCINEATVEGSDGVGGIVGHFRPNIVLDFGKDPIKTMTGQMNSMVSSVKDLNNSIRKVDFDLGESDFDMNAQLNNIRGSLEALENSRKEGNDNITNVDFGNLNLDNLNADDLGDLIFGSLGTRSTDTDTDGEKKEENTVATAGTNITINGYDPDVLFSVMNDFSNSFGEIYNEGERVAEKVDSTLSSKEMTDVSNKIDNMMNQMQSMVGTVGNLEANIGMNIEDVSREDKEEDIIGKVASCKNTGLVMGENAVGGIAGQMALEMMLSENDVEVNGDPTMSAEGTIRLVVRNCENYGAITGSKSYVGGIGGNMAQGAIIDCRNIGNLDSLNANYVGGVLGNCDTVIMNCYSKSVLAGKNYVGGIAGRSVEVHDSYAFVDIVACNEFGGSILGNSEELPEDSNEFISNNFYCFTGKDYGGIDGINYVNATGRISLSDYLALENLNEMFKTVTVCFKAEGQEDIVLSAALGGNISVDNVPELTVDENQMYDWQLLESVTAKTPAMGEEKEVSYLSEKQLKNIMFDLTYEADFEPKNTVCQGDEKTENGKSIILAIGAFDKDTTIKTTDVTQEENLILGETALQNIQVDISNTGVKKLHYRIPDNIDAEAIKIMVKDKNANWSERAFIVEGSYLIFDFTDNDSRFAFVAVEKSGFSLEDFKLPEGIDYTLIGAIAAAVLVLLFMIVYIKKNYTIVKKDK